MNGKPKVQAKKILFEPKIPAPKQNIPVEPPAKKDTQQEPPQNIPIRGVYAPKTFSSPKEFKFGNQQFIMSIPGSFNDCSLLVFEDGTFGIKHNDQIFECDASFLGDALSIELDDKARIVGNPEFLLSVYPSEIEKPI
ncbi:hypothetical protein GINT2_001775 [Glugoides intestinalis]